MTRKVVVIGAGYTGSAVAKELDEHAGQNDLEVTLVDQRASFVHKIGSLRASTVPGWSDNVLVPRDKLLVNGKLITDVVTKVTTASVELESGDSLPYDYCVLATGTVNKSPGEPGPEARSDKELREFFAKNVAAIKEAKKPVIIGGGVVGVELAGEIKSAYPEKEVTIIHAGKTLISHSRPPLPTSFHNKLNAQLKDLGVRVLLNAKADVKMADFAETPAVAGPRTIVTSSGDKVESDLTIVCVGSTPSTAPFPGEWLDASKFVKVDTRMRVLDAKGEVVPKVFAVGDICSFAENKMAYYGEQMVGVVIKNMLAATKGQPLSAEYEPHVTAKTLMMSVPLGVKGGVTSIYWGNLGAFLTRTIKGKTLFYEKSWAANRAVAPKQASSSSSSGSSAMLVLGAAVLAVAAYYCLDTFPSAPTLKLPFGI